MADVEKLADLLQRLVQPGAVERSSRVIAHFADRGVSDSSTVTSRHDVVINLADSRFDEQSVAHAIADLKVMGEVFSLHPKPIVEALRAIAEGQLFEAARILREIGLTEEKLQARGGNFIGLDDIIVIALVIILVSLPGNAPKPDSVALHEKLETKQSTSSVNIDDATAADIAAVDSGLFRH